jgi:chemotaxis signal transduction protein
MGGADEPTREASSAAERAAGAVERRLVFDLATNTYALRLTEISGVAAMGTLRAVPKAPPGVLGLAEWRGRPLTVVDLPRLLGEDPGKGPASLVRLAPPFDHLALFVPAGLRVEESIFGARIESARVLAPEELAEALLGDRLPSARDRALRPD